jgi:hypothetical protein
LELSSAAGPNELPSICYSTTGSLVAATGLAAAPVPEIGIILGRMLFWCYSN